MNIHPSFNISYQEAISYNEKLSPDSQRYVERITWAAALLTCCLAHESAFTWAVKKCYLEEHGREEDGVQLIEERVRRVARFSEVEIQPYVIGSSDFNKSYRRNSLPVEGVGSVNRIAPKAPEKGDDTKGIIYRNISKYVIYHLEPLPDGLEIKPIGKLKNPLKNIEETGLTESNVKKYLQSFKTNSFLITLQDSVYNLYVKEESDIKIIPFDIDDEGKIALLNEEKSFTRISEFLAYFNTKKSLFVKAS